MNNAYQGTERPDYSLAPATATFRQRDLETKFQQQTLARTQQQLRASVTFGAVFEVTFWLTGIAALGYNGTTQMLLLARLFVALTVICMLYLIAKNPHSVTMPRRAATLAEIVAMCTFMLVILNRPAEIHWHAMSMSTMLLVFYLFIPNTFLNATSVALTSTVAFVALALQVGTLSHSDTVTMILALTFTNVFGILAAHRHASLSRQEFQAQQIERQALATQRQFVAMLSHEFRTPLAIIDTTIQRLGFALEVRMPEFTPRVSKIRRAVARMLNLLENCLTEDRLATTDLVLHVEPVDLRELIHRSNGNQSVPGAGLGLHLARELARHHGGNVTLAPESEHTGAIFTLSLLRSKSIATKP